MMSALVRPRLWILLVLAVCAGGCQDLPVIPAGCQTLLAGSICEVRPEGQLRLFVKTASPTLLTVRQGLRSLPFSSTPVEGGTLLVLTVRPGVERLRITERSGLSMRSRTLVVRESQTETWLQEARAEWEKHDQIKEAERLLRAGLARPLSARARAEALGLLARIVLEQLRVSEAKQLFEQALDADREAGLLSNAAWDTCAAAALRVEYESRAQEAEDKLSSGAAVFEQTPDAKPYVQLHLARYRRLQGALQPALEAIAEARRLATQLGDQEALGNISEEAAYVLQALGRWKEAREELVGLAAVRAGSHCLQADTLSAQGRLEITARETRPPDTELQDPRVVLRESLRLRREQCNQVKRIADTLTDLSWAELLMGSSEAAVSALEGAKALVPDPDRSLKEAWLDLEGALALAASDTATAEERYRELLRLSLLPQEKRAPSATPERDLYDNTWRAHIGLAKTLHKAGRLGEAERSFQQAEEFLDRRSPELPLAEGRVSYLGRHEYGTAAYLELLHEQKRNADALKVLRRARARGLRALLRLADPARLSPEQRRRWDEAVGKYRALRMKIDATAGQQALAVTSSAKLHEDERRRLELALSRALEEAFAVLEEQPEQPLRKPAPDEALLGCHPLTAGWLCLLARGSEPVQAVRLSGDLTDEKGAELIAELAGPLRQATRLTVLSYGAQMERLDFGRFPLSGQPLQEQLDVVYGLDLPVPPPSVTSPRRALLTIDPTDRFAWAGRLQLAPLLRNESGWSFSEITHAHPMTSEQLLQQLGTAELFVYFGHAQVAPVASRRFLQTDERSGVQALDILTLQSVPRQVVLIACESGLAKEGTGGVLGLGLAQAFLLRGSQSVIATTRKIDARLGKRLAEGLLRDGMSELSSKPAQRLRMARKDIESGEARGESFWKDITAVRVFVP